LLDSGRLFYSICRKCYRIGLETFRYRVHEQNIAHSTAHCNYDCLRSV
jgi:hypothetical protein